MVDNKNKKTKTDIYEAKKVAAVGGNIAGLLVAIGLMFVGSIFVMTGFTGDKPIAALILGTICTMAGLALITSLIINMFRKKPGHKTSSQ